MELAKLRLELEEQDRIRQFHLKLAARVHEGFLPPPVHHPRIDISTRYVPVDGIGGDYCQVLFPRDSVCYVTICDVTGHGIGPALLASLVSSEVRRLTFHCPSPFELLQQVNKFVLDYFREAQLQLSFFACRLDLDDRTMIYSGAGHPAQLLMRRNSEQLELLCSQNMLLGVAEDCVGDAPQETALLCPGDHLLFFTDGLTETQDVHGQLLGELGLTKIATDLCAGTAFELADCILRRIEQFRHGPAADDMTLIAAELK